jgi:very-short-patch-repair endonuclease
MTLTPTLPLPGGTVCAQRFMGLAVRRQAPECSCIVDFLIPDHRLDIEAGGGGFGGSRGHVRDQWVTKNNFHTFRSRNRDILPDLTDRLEAIAARTATHASRRANIDPPAPI